tara:strand:+ start:325 stop:768 length:444 start_codon:yes stop_codon:yes gene_type:complete
MEITNKYHKTHAISNWKRKGVIYHDFDELYEVYIKTMNCSHCEKDFKNTKDRCLDHDHDTGAFRKIVCQTCNIHDNYIRFPNGVPSEKERKKISFNNNKHKYIDSIKKNNNLKREKNICECGCIISYSNIARHEKSLKHIRFMEQQD